MEQPNTWQTCHHQFGQRYDERRGCGNGEQFCFGCQLTLNQLLDNVKREALDQGRREVKEEYRNRALTELQEIARTDTNLSKEGRLQISAFIEGMKSRI